MARRMATRRLGVSCSREVRTRLGLETLEVRDLLDGTTLLIGTWNVGIADAARRLGGYATVLAGIGNESSYAAPQAPDILAITETRSNAYTGAAADTDFLTQILNGIYGDGTYDHGTLNGQTTGGGTDGVIYNTQTVSLLEEAPVGAISASGAARQELRYLFRPVGYDDGSADFYVYVGHYKAGTTSTDLNRRNVEAQQVRADADALGDGTHIIYTGDFNADSSNEPAMRTLLAAGSGQAVDPINRLGQWYNTNAMRDIMTEATAVAAPTGLTGGGLKNRFSLLWETAPVIGDYGLQALPSTYHSFGNDGSVPLRQSIDYPGSTALPDLDNRLDVLYALAHDTSDQVPVLEEHQVVTPGPSPHRDGRANRTALTAAAATSATAPTPFGGHPTPIQLPTFHGERFAAIDVLRAWQNTESMISVTHDDRPITIAEPPGTALPWPGDFGRFPELAVAEI